MNKKPETKNICMRFHTFKFLQELVSLDKTGQSGIALGILWKLLESVAERALKIDDKELNKLMLRLALYANADPDSECYDPDSVEEYLQS